MNRFRKFYNELLDRSILFSFDKTGYRRHQKQFNPLDGSLAKGKSVVITGGSSGIGLAAAKYFLEHGSKVTVLSRELSKALENLKSDYNQTMRHLAVDLADYRSLKKIVHDLPNVDILVNNAGGMPSYECQQGNLAENIFASQVLGHYCLTRMLIESGKLSDNSRVVFVASGGMYLQRLDLNDLCFKTHPYNKYTAYANAKRAQVILTEILAEIYPNVLFGCCHPGWADTPGVNISMPWFHRLLRHRLRTPEEGADTVLWLALSPEVKRSGGFYFDRNEAPVHLLKKTVESESERKNLIKLCYESYDAIL